MRLRRKSGQKGHGQKSEELTGKRLKAEQVAGSGAIQGYKGDLRQGEFMIECKSTVNKSLGVKLEWLRKVAKEARDEGIRPALHIAFVTGDGHPIKDGTWIMMREVDFQQLVDEAES